MWKALDDTYSKYEKQLFSSFGIYHKKLEICAIQKYSSDTHLTYVPVLENGLSNLFDHKYNQVCENFQFQNMLDNFNSLASEQGFQFLNSTESIKLQEQMRMFELSFLNKNELNEAFDKDIDSYENSMIRNIQSYCKENQFDKAIFLCGVAHRNSIIKKIESFNRKGKNGY